jgi:hypothetical protein
MMQIQLLVVNVLQDMELNMLRAEMLLAIIRKGASVYGVCCASACP